MGSNLITFTLHSLMSRYLHQFEINLVRPPSYCPIYIKYFQTMKYYVTIFYMSLYLSNADKVRVITGRNYDSKLTIYAEIDTYWGIWILLQYYTSRLLTKSIMNILTLWNFYLLMFLSPFHFKWPSCKFIHLLYVHATIFQNVFWKPLVK